MEDAEKDLREMKVKIWQRKIVDRQEWVSVIKKAQTVRGL